MSPLVLASAFVLLMLLVGALAFMQPGVVREPASMQAEGGTQPSPLATPTPEPTPTPTPEDANKKRGEKKPVRRAPEKKDSKVGRAVKKLKKIFKNPF